MLTDDELREAFMATNTAEPLAEGWPGLERFAREVERRVEEKHLPLADRYGKECDVCGVFHPLSKLQWNGAQLVCFPICG